MGTFLMEWSKHIAIDYPVKLTRNIKSTHKLEFNIKCVSFEIIPENHEKKLTFSIRSLSLVISPFHKLLERTLKSHVINIKCGLDLNKVNTNNILLNIL